VSQHSASRGAHLLWQNVPDRQATPGREARGAGRRAAGGHGRSGAISAIGV